MFKTAYTKYLLILITTLLAITAAACTDTAVSTLPETNTAVSLPETTDAVDALPAPVVDTLGEVDAETAVNAAPNITLATQNTGSPTADEIAGLLFMREEEKLAHDVYLTMNDLWGMNIFNNIAAIEQVHTGYIVDLLNTYGIADPAANNSVGQFTNQDLQALYDQLIAAGSQSLADALKVGGAIEEIDILDLDKRINNTSNSDILNVYQNLRAGSENHLQSFAGNYERQTGAAYQPQYLDQADYDTIINNTANRGNGNGQGNSNGQGQGNGQGNGNGNGGGQGNGNGKGSGNGQNG